jgi:hypothetical protein
VGNPNWKPGVSGNPKGRPRGKIRDIPDINPAEFEDVLSIPPEDFDTIDNLAEEAAKDKRDPIAAKAAADKHDPPNPPKIKTPVRLLLDFANVPKHSVGLRTSAAAAVAPYLHPKWGSRPVPRIIDAPIELRSPHTIEDATNNIAQIVLLQAAGLIDLDTGNDLIAANKVVIDALQTTVIEQRLAALEQLRGISPPTATIGGLPPLPGTNIDMSTQTPTIIGGGIRAYAAKAVRHRCSAR